MVGLQEHRTTASPYWQNIYDPTAEWAPCYYDETHNLTAYAVYELPIGQGKRFGNNMNKVENAVVGGWTVSPIMTLHTGFPLALYTNASDPTGTGSRGLRPDCNGTNTVYGRSPAPAGTGGGFLWFDPSNYSEPNNHLRNLRAATRWIAWTWILQLGYQLAEELPT